MDDGLVEALQRSPVTPGLPIPRSRPQPTQDLEHKKINLQVGSISGEESNRHRSAQTYRFVPTKSMIEKSRIKSPQHSLVEVAGSKRCKGLWKCGEEAKIELPPLPTIEDITSCQLLRGINEDQHVNLPLLHSHTLRYPKLYSAYSWPASSPVGDFPVRNSSGSVPPLTPPHEVNMFNWTVSEAAPQSPRHHSLSSEQDGSRIDLTSQQQPSSSTRPSTISLPGFADMTDQNTSPSTWLDRTVNTIGKSDDSHSYFS